MSKENNLTDFLTDVADAIRNKKGTTDKINPQDFSDEIKSIKTSTSMWTGHADVEGLKAIGWDDEDIAYYQEHGVNWMEEDDEYHKVSDDNKALYGVLTADNIQEYKDRIVYLPKIDFSGVKSAYKRFSDCTKMVAIPMIDTSNCAYFYYFFYNCYSLTCIPRLDTSKATNVGSMFRFCNSLTYVPNLDIKNATSVNRMFTNCIKLRDIPILDYENATDIEGLYSSNYSVICIPNIIDTKGTPCSNIVSECVNITNVKLKNINSNLNIKSSQTLSKTSLFYIINNEAATSAITITINAQVYTRLSTDPDILEALANHPNVSLASA